MISAEEAIQIHALLIQKLSPPLLLLALSSEAFGEGRRAALDVSGNSKTRPTSDMTTTLDLRKVFGVIMTYNTNQAPNKPFEMEAKFEPGAKSGIHVHPEQDEHYYITGGEMEVYLNGSWNKLRVGEEMHIPKGAEHAFRNSGGQQAIATNQHIPGLRTQEYYETMGRLINEGKITGMTGLRNGIYLSLHAVKFADVVILHQPPDAFIKIIAILGRLCGYKV